MFEVQNGRLAGYYHLYDDEGNPIWFLITGDLQRSEIEGVMWFLETDLEYFHGGACLNCDHQTPMLGDSPGRIKLEFLERNLGRFSTNGGRSQNITPMTFGVIGSRPFTPLTRYVLPDLSGGWVFVFDNPMWDGRASSTADLYGLSRDDNLEPGDIVSARYFINRADAFPGVPDFIAEVGLLECIYEEGYGPVCEIRFERGPDHLIENTFVIRLANIGHRRFIGQAENGFVIEGFRIGFD